MSQVIDGCTGSSLSSNRSLGRRRGWALAVATVALSHAALAFAQGVDEPEPRVGEIPTGCNTNAFNAQISVLGGTCVGNQLTFAINLTNPLNPNDPPFKNCQASNVVVRFWAPGNVPNNFPDICGSTNETINLTTVVNGGPITMLPPATQTYIGGPGLPQLLYTPAAPGLVTAYVCITGTSNTSTTGTPIVNARAVDITISAPPPCSISGNASVCTGQTTPWCAPEGANFTYLWEGPGVAGQTTRCVNVGSAGEYCVTVTDTTTGCTTRCCRTLSVNQLPDCTITGLGSVCFGQTTQWCAPEGANLTYLWEGPGVDGATSRCVTVGTAGQYCVTVTDTQTGCSQRCCRTLNNFELPLCGISGSDAVCAGQSTQWCATDGAGFTYLWEGPGVAGLTTRCVTVGAPGEYCVTITDANGCSSRCCKTLTNNSGPECSISGPASVCTGQTTQWCAPEGANFTYLWEGTGVAGLTTRCVTVGAAGEYCVTITNTLTGCSSRCCRTLTVNQLPNCTITGSGSVCSGQTTQWCAPEGVGLTYVWEGAGVAGFTTRCVTVGTPGEYCVTVTDANGCSQRCCKTLTSGSGPECSISGPASVCTGQTTQWCAPEGAGLTYLWEGPGVAGQTTRCVTVGSAGEYCVTITDSASGCSSRCCRTLTVNTLPDCTITGSSTVCPGQTTQWCAPEGQGYTYVWEGAGVAGLTTRCVTVGTPGEYCVTVTDANGCSKRCCKTLSTGTGPTCSITGAGSVCTGQTTEWCAPAGSGFTYLWEGTGVDGLTTRCVTVGTPGEYCVTVTDSKGCSSRCCKTLTNGNGPECSISGSSSVCQGSSAQWCAPTGTGLTYLWEGPGVAGQTTRCVTVNTAGEYCVTVTKNGCSTRCCKTLTVKPKPDCTISGADYVCEGQSTQWCAPEGSGYTYLWEGEGVNGATTRCVTVSSACEYCVTVTKDGCSKKCCKTLQIRKAPDCAITGASSICQGSTTQWCATSGSGYTYVWEGPGVAGQTTRCVTVSAPGEYCVTITKNGCSTRCCKTLTNTPGPNCTILGADAVCEGSSVQWCAPSGSGFTYLWEGPGIAGATTRCVTVSIGGEYCVTVTKDGCSKRCCKTLVVTPDPNCTILGNDAVCEGSTVQWCAPSGAGYTYLWNGPGVVGATTRCVQVSAPGDYCVIVTQNGCSSKCCKTLVVGNKPNCEISGEGTVCDGSTTQWCAPGGSNYTYSWTGPGVTGQTSRCVNVGVAGDYCVIVTSNGCSSKCCKTLTVEDCGGNDGCTPCYWKDCRNLWNWPAPYTPQTLFKNACAGNPSKCFENAFNGKVLFQVIRQSGTGLNALGRETVAALLNAASPGVDYPLTPEQVIQMFNDVYPGGNYNQLKDLFKQYNSAGCPFCGPSDVAAKTHNQCDRCDDAGRSISETGQPLTASPDSDDCTSSPGGDCGTTGLTAGLAAPLMLGTWMISRRRRRFRGRVG